MTWLDKHRMADLMSESGRAAPTQREEERPGYIHASKRGERQCEPVAPPAGTKGHPCPTCGWPYVKPVAPRHLTKEEQLLMERALSASGRIVLGALTPEPVGPPAVDGPYSPPEIEQPSDGAIYSAASPSPAIGEVDNALLRDLLDENVSEEVREAIASRFRSLAAEKAQYKAASEAQDAYNEKAHVNDDGLCRECGQTIHEHNYKEPCPVAPPAGDRELIQGSVGKEFPCSEPSPSPAIGDVDITEIKEFLGHGCDVEKLIERLEQGIDSVFDPDKGIPEAEAVMDKAAAILRALAAEKSNYLEYENALAKKRDEIACLRAQLERAKEGLEKIGDSAFHGDYGCCRIARATLEKLK